MMKKIFFALSVFFALVCLIFQHSRAEASDYYLGEYPNGQIAYMDTSSIRVTNHYSNGYHDGDTYTCIVKAVDPGSDRYDKVHYEIYVGQTESIKKNGIKLWQTIRGDAHFLENNPVEAALLKYFEQRHKEDWKKVPERIK